MGEFDDNPEFQKLLAGRDDVDLVQFMLELAADAYPQLDRMGCLLEIDRLGVACCDHQSQRRASCTRSRLVATSQLLYEIEGFHGNCEGYYEAQNSYLNDVLARRCGIPISLGILYMAVASRTGLKMFGVNAPGHFVVGCAGGGEPCFVDPFTNGDVLDRASCKSRLDRMLNKPGVIGDDDLCAAAPRDIAARVLRNLKTSHAMHNRWPAALRVQQRLAALLPQIAEEQRDLGLVHLRVGQPGKALAVLNEYANICDAQQAAAVQPSIRTAHRMIAELN